eukprot:3674713-Rhodomonas_salina.1
MFGTEGGCAAPRRLRECFLPGQLPKLLSAPLRYFLAAPVLTCACLVAAPVLTCAYLIATPVLIFANAATRTSAPTSASIPSPSQASNRFVNSHLPSVTLRTSCTARDLLSGSQLCTRILTRWNDAALTFRTHS